MKIKTIKLAQELNPDSTLACVMYDITQPGIHLLGLYEPDTEFFYLISLEFPEKIGPTTG